MLILVGLVDEKGVDTEIVELIDTLVHLAVQHLLSLGLCVHTRLSFGLRVNGGA